MPRCPQDMNMVYDFQQTFKTYDKNIYNRAYFKFTPCPTCPAIGRFIMHGSYERYAIFFVDDEIIHEFKELKRILCKSCKTTHAVVPGDMIPYKTLSLFVLISILTSFYLKNTPVLKIANRWKLSFQFIYSVLWTLEIALNNIRQYIRERYPGISPPNIDVNTVLVFIKMQNIKFQSGYIKHNRKPCFMCKFFNRTGVPPVGFYEPKRIAT